MEAKNQKLIRPLSISVVNNVIQNLLNSSHNNFKTSLIKTLQKRNELKRIKLLDGDDKSSNNDMKTTRFLSRWKCLLGEEKFELKLSTSSILQSYLNSTSYFFHHFLQNNVISRNMQAVFKTQLNQCLPLSTNLPALMPPNDSKPVINKADNKKYILIPIVDNDISIDDCSIISIKCNNKHFDEHYDIVFENNSKTILLDLIPNLLKLCKHNSQVDILARNEDNLSIENMPNNLVKFTKSLPALHSMSNNKTRTNVLPNLNCSWLQKTQPMTQRCYSTLLTMPDESEQHVEHIKPIEKSFTEKVVHNVKNQITRQTRKIFENHTFLNKKEALKKNEKFNIETKFKKTNTNQVASKLIIKKTKSKKSNEWKQFSMNTRNKILEPLTRRNQQQRSIFNDNTTALQKRTLLSASQHENVKFHPMAFKPSPTCLAIDYNKYRQMSAPNSRKYSSGRPALFSNDQRNISNRIPSVKTPKSKFKHDDKLTLDDLKINRKSKKSNTLFEQNALLSDFRMTPKLISHYSNKYKTRQPLIVNSQKFQERSTLEAQIAKQNPDWTPSLDDLLQLNKRFEISLTDPISKMEYSTSSKSNKQITLENISNNKILNHPSKIIKTEVQKRGKSNAANAIERTDKKNVELNQLIYKKNMQPKSAPAIVNADTKKSITSTVVANKFQSTRANCTFKRDYHNDCRKHTDFSKNNVKELEQIVKDLTRALTLLIKKKKESVLKIPSNNTTKPINISMSTGRLRAGRDLPPCAHYEINDLDKTMQTSEKNEPCYLTSCKFKTSLPPLIEKPDYIKCEKCDAYKKVKDIKPQSIDNKCPLTNGEKSKPCPLFGEDSPLNNPKCPCRIKEIKKLKQEPKFKKVDLNPFTDGPFSDMLTKFFLPENKGRMPAIIGYTPELIPIYGPRGAAYNVIGVKKDGTPIYGAGGPGGPPPPPNIRAFNKLGGPMYEPTDPEEKFKLTLLGTCSQDNSPITGHPDLEGGMVFLGKGEDGFIKYDALYPPIEEPKGLQIPEIKITTKKKKRPKEKFPLEYNLGVNWPICVFHSKCQQNIQKLPKRMGWKWNIRRYIYRNEKHPKFYKNILKPGSILPKVRYIIRRHRKQRNLKPPERLLNRMNYSHNRCIWYSKPEKNPPNACVYWGNQSHYCRCPEFSSIRV